MNCLSSWFWLIVAVGVLIGGWLNLASPMPLLERGYENWRVLK